MQVAIYGCGALGGIGAVIISLLVYYHKEIPLVWTTFATVVISILGVCLFWQSKVLEKQSSPNGDSVQNKGNGIYVNKDVKGIHIEGAITDNNQNNGIYIVQGADVKLKNTKSNYNKGNGISIEKSK